MTDLLELAADITDSMVDAALNARLSNGAPVLAYLPSSSRWEPDDRAKEIIFCAIQAALIARAHGGGE